MKSFVINHRTWLVLAVCVAIGVGGTTLAQHTGTGQVKSEQLSQRDIIEKLDGKDASATVRMVTIGPGQEDTAHRIPGDEIVHVLGGSLEYQLEGQPPVTLRAGDVLFIPAGTIHEVKNVANDDEADPGITCAITAAS